MADQARDLERAFDGLRAGIAEKDPIHAREAGELAGQPLLPWNAHQVARVHQRRRLVGNLPGQRRMRVA
jgi:hypothetical protein